MSKKIEEILNKKLSSETSKSFDKDFWQKFDNEQKSSKTSWFSIFSAVAAMAIFIFAISWQLQNNSIEKAVTQIQDEEAEILADLDDQDWEILLGEDFDS